MKIKHVVHFEGIGGSGTATFYSKLNAEKYADALKGFYRRIVVVTEDTIASYPADETGDELTELLAEMGEDR